EAEGEVAVRYREQVGKFPDGESFRLRFPTYEISRLHFGPLAPDTTIQPRLAPALFGTGLLEKVPGAAAGRFGWQNTAVSLSEQTAQALSRDMGLTSPLLDHDDCMIGQTACLGAPHGGAPEIDPEYFEALIAFQSHLAVPERGPSDAKGGQLFDRLGCGT